MFSCDKILLTVREQKGRDRRNDDGQDQDAHSPGQLARERQDACEPAAEEACGDAAEHDAILLADGNDNGEEHSEEHDRKAAHGPYGHKIAHQHAEHGAETPARHGGAHRADVIPHVKISRLGDGKPEDLIREVVGKEHTPAQGRIGREMLTERAAHQKITRVDDQHHNGHGKKTGIGRDDGDAAVLAGRGVVQEAQQKALEHAQMRAVRADADAEADGEIAKPDGDTVTEPPQEDVF